MAEKENPRGNKKGRSFYYEALTEAERFELEQACSIEGIDEEIALLRVKLKELVQNEPDRIDLYLRGASTLARLVHTRYQITTEQKKSLKDAIARVLTEVALPLGIGVGMNVAGK
ncbi:MAG: hypothetical protein U9R04_06105 [Chloroflexota bacterium]|nr:hypothetical protein [Chloroflexota bacterium]